MTIPPSLFEAFLKCPTKCRLRFAGELPSGNTYAEWVQTEIESYRAEAAKRLTANSPAEECAACRSSRHEEAHSSAENLKTAKWRLAIDIPARTEFGSSRGNEAQTSPPGNSQSILTPTATVETCLHAVERIPSAGRGQPAQFIPIRFIYRNKLTKDDKLLLAFDAFVLAEMLGRAVSRGKIIHGDDRDCARSSRGNEAQTEKSEISQRLLTSAATQPRVTKVKTSALAGEVRKRLGKITALLASPAPPDLVLNRHCAECEFQARCRKLAVEKDDLSLLAGMSAKERQKLRSKGIFTVTQLSYTFRPRRRPKRQRDKREKYHHALKALAIREQKIHIVGSPELKLEGTPVYLDVEGLPDRDFYYLIGVRIGHGDSAVQHSLWADTIADEGKIWREFLALLETVEQPVLIHYGSYETGFLKEMNERHGGFLDDSVVAKVIGSAVNVVSAIFAKYYFPTLTNGLKDIAGFLKFKWSEREPSGMKAVLWRHHWEKTRSAELRKTLCAYNTEDCHALEIILNGLILLSEATANGVLDSPETALAVSVETIKSSEKRFGNFSSQIPEFMQINKTARWDYQRDRIYVRTSKLLKRKANQSCERRLTRPNVVKSVPYMDRPVCPLCGGEGRSRACCSRILRDLSFGKTSVKRWIVNYRFCSYWCPRCHQSFGTPDQFWPQSKYGRNLVAYLIFMSIELCIPVVTVGKLLTRFFDLEVPQGTLFALKGSAASQYKTSCDKILSRLTSGNMLHVDETQVSIRGKTAYVWVFTNLHEVAYVYADSREGAMLQELLKDYKGILVSDFYGVYDSLACPQQKCLVHLMRDLNDEVLDHPYDEELKEIVRSFALILKGIVETIDRRGLKRRFLGKHRPEVARFFRKLAGLDCRTDAAIKCRQRFERNRDKLFTFLSYDGVPWNNNNAEHAIKAFAKLRDVIRGSCTQDAARNYLVLLSLCETCKYMGVDFLDFLRSGEKDIHAFAESRRRRKRPAPTRPPPSGGQSA